MNCAIGNDGSNANPRAASPPGALAGRSPVRASFRQSQAWLLEAIARDALGNPGAAERALEHALDVAEPDGIFYPFLLYPAPRLLERHARQRTAHAWLLAEIRSLLAGNTPVAPSARPRPLVEPLSDSEIRVLCYLPTNLSGPEIANELYVSPNTVKTHIRHLYGKLGTHRRGEAVARARASACSRPPDGADPARHPRCAAARRQSAADHVDGVMLVHPAAAEAGRQERKRASQAEASWHAGQARPPCHA